MSKAQEIMEKHIGRDLYRNELVHHIDCDKKNNDIDNLFLIKIYDHIIPIHNSLKSIGYCMAKKALRDGKIEFNKKKKRYEVKQEYFDELIDDEKDRSDYITINIRAKAKLRKGS